MNLKTLKKQLTLKNVVVAIVAILVLKWMWQYFEQFTGEANLAPILSPVPEDLKNKDTRQRAGNNDRSLDESVVEGTIDGGKGAFNDCSAGSCSQGTCDNGCPDGMFDM